MIKFGFLTYISRSGSTLLSNLLNQYKDVCIATEAHLPPELFGIKYYKPVIFNNVHSLLNYLEILERTSKFKSWNLDLNVLHETILNQKYPITGPNLVKILLTQYLYEKKPYAEVIIYKGAPILPWESFKVKKYFQGSYIIHIYRDPRAVYNSQKRSDFPYEKRKFSQNPIEVAKDWKKSINTLNSVPNTEVFQIKYEDLVINSIKTINSTLEYLGAYNELDKIQNNFYNRLPDEEKLIHININKQPDMKRINSWKQELNGKDIRLLDCYLKNDIEQAGYKLTDQNKSFLITYSLILFKIISYEFNKTFRRLKRIITQLLKVRGLHYYKLKSLFIKSL